MPETPEKKLSAADIRRLLTEKFPPVTNADGSPSKENVYVAVVLALTEDIEIAHKRIVHLARMQKGFATIIGKLSAAAGVDLAALMQSEAGDEADDTVLGGTGAGGGGAGPGGAGGGSGGGGGGGVAATSPNPVADKTPFPAGVPTTAPPGTAGSRVAKVETKTVDEEDLTPSVQSGPAVNARPNVTPPPANGQPRS